LSEEYDSSNIQVLKGLESVRKRPALYLGDLDSPDLTTRLAFQTICHAVDEVIEGNCSDILMLVKNDTVLTRYDTGLPLDSHPAADELPAAIIFLAMHMACHNQKKNVEVGSELCELGLAVLNGVCSELVAIVCSKGNTAEFIFAKGLLQNKPTLVATDRENSTSIQINLDGSILKSTEFDISKIRQEANRISDKYRIPIRVEKMS